ncbi:MAG: hypothetical protein IJ237_08695 [Oscillospiraceae bacterium]|nr:hypothetical protein [Oscillospiraceae bacterium]
MVRYFIRGNGGFERMYAKKKKASCGLPGALLCSFILLFCTVFQTTALAETDLHSEWKPDSYEIHLLLNSDLVLDENHLLKQGFLKEFGADDSYKTFSLAYYETQDRDFFEEGWINRIRLKYEENDENDFKLTYKKRYPVPEGDMTSAIRLAETEGFDLSSNFWEPQIDWGYTGMTLSLSAEASVPADTEETIADLHPEEGFSMMIENMPAEEQNWKEEQWGSRTFQSAEVVGPIFFNRYKGDYLDQKVKIEIWEIHDERDDAIHYLTELSFEAKDYQEASNSREMMMDALLDLGILLKVDSLKTQQMLDAYLVSPQ